MLLVFKKYMIKVCYIFLCFKITLKAAVFYEDVIKKTVIK